MPPTDPEDGPADGAGTEEAEGSEEDAEGESEAGTAAQKDAGADADRDGGDRSSSGLGFSLPPIRLPPFFPADFRLRFPLVGRLRAATTPRRALLAALLFDAADAALALTTGPPVAYVRTVAGTLVAGVLAGPGGAVAAWEVAAVLLGAPAATLFPTVAALVVVRFVLLR
jgi:hypothetical protein